MYRMIQFFSLSVFVSAVALVMPLAWQSSKLPTDASLRGVAVSPGGVIIVAGTGPQVWVMNNSGQAWSDRTPDIIGVTDYRCAVTPSDSVLIVASAGSPAVILRSVDLGVQWSTVHSDTRPAAFLDAIQFWDARRGITFGDPVGGEFLILGTDDAGQTWRNLTCTVKPLEGEAGFAASNGSISLAGDSSIAIGLGGRADGGNSRVLISPDAGQTWTPYEVSVMPANASSGIFSMVLRESGFGIAVGGDYKLPDDVRGNVAVTDDHGKTWRLPKGQRPRGFRSSVIYVPSRELAAGYWISTGPSGTDISDDGESWRALSETGFHSLALMPNGTPIATGSDGRFAFLTDVQ
jgi:photosystem II stability/assembly factor-like uncharacterized protein